MINHVSNLNVIVKIDKKKVGSYSVVTFDELHLIENISNKVNVPILQYIDKMK